MSGAKSDGEKREISNFVFSFARFRRKPPYCWRGVHECVCVRPQTWIHAALVERSTEKIVKNFTTRTHKISFEWILFSLPLSLRSRSLFKTFLFFRVWIFRSIYTFNMVIASKFFSRSTIELSRQNQPQKLNQTEVSINIFPISSQTDYMYLCFALFSCGFLLFTLRNIAWKSDFLSPLASHYYFASTPTQLQVSVCESSLGKKEKFGMIWRGDS